MSAIPRPPENPQKSQERFLSPEEQRAWANFRFALKHSTDSDPTIKKVDTVAKRIFG